MIHDLLFLLGVASVFFGGVMTGVGLQTRKTTDFVGGILGLIWGLTLLITHVG